MLINTSFIFNNVLGHDDTAGQSCGQSLQQESSLNARLACLDRLGDAMQL